MLLVKCNDVLEQKQAALLTSCPGLHHPPPQSENHFFERGISEVRRSIEMKQIAEQEDLEKGRKGCVSNQNDKTEIVSWR
jgi:hypothetical protein